MGSCYLAVFTHFMSPQEKALFRKITSNLNKVGDQIAITNIHQGDWISACLNPTDVFSSMEHEAVTIKDVTVMNDKYPMSGEADWGLYFVYPGNKIEYYAFPNNKILADTSRGWYSENKNCAKRENAYLKLKNIYDGILQISLVGN